MADNIPNIVIEIESNASGAVSQLDQLANSLLSLKKATGNSNVLSTFSKNFETLNRSIRFMNNIDPSKAESIKRMAEAAGSFKGITISKTIGDGITSINTSLNALSEDNMAKLFEFANTMFLLKEMQGFRYPTSINTGLLKTAELAEQIKDADFTKLKELVETITQLGHLSVEDSGAVKQLANSMKVLTTETKKANTHGKKFNTVLANIRTKTMAVYMGLARLARGATKTMSVYGDYVEALNLYKMAMGGAAEEGYKFAETAQAILGIDLTQWMQAQGVFMALGKGFGVAEEKAAIMSKNLTQLAYDISSFYNISVEDAIQKVQSGFAGQIRPVRNLGYDLSQARLEAIALANGIDEEVKSMTQAEKSQLRYIALMTQLTEVQGDLARTLDSPTNQLRLLNAQIDQMTRSIGMTLLPLMNKAIPYLNAVFRVIKMIAEEIAAMFGYTLPRITGGDWSTNVSIGADEIEDSLEDANGAAEKLKNTLASFDQINLITSKSGGSGSGSGGSISSSDLGLDLPEYDFLGDATENRAQQIADNMMKSLRPFVDWLKDAIKWTVDNIDTIAWVLTTLATVTIGKNLLNSLLNVFGVAEKLSGAVGALGNIAIGVSLSYLGGTDMAKGDWLKGAIESTIGTAALALGFGFFFGGPGVVIGVTVGIAMTLIGYANESYKQKLEELRKTFFGEFKEYKTSVEEFERSWNEFLDGFKNPDLEEKNTTADKLKTDVEEIGRSIETLQEQYRTGTVTGIAYANNLEQVYSRAEESIKEHIEAVNTALDESLNGPLGLWLEAHGVSLDRLRNSFKTTTDEIIAEIERNNQKMQEYTHQYEIGQLTLEQYNAKVQPLIDDLKKYYDITGMNTEATSEFINQFSNVAVDFDNWDQVYATLEEVSKGYDDAKKSIEALENADVSRLESYLPFASDEDKKVIEAALEETRNYYANQKAILKQGYQDVLDSFSETAVLDWKSVVDKEGFENAFGGIMDDLYDFDDKLNEIYGKEGLNRNQTYFTELINLFEEYEGKMVDLIDDGKNPLNVQKDILDGMDDDLRKFMQKYDYHLLEQKSKTEDLTTAEKTYFDQLREKYGDTVDQLGDFTKQNNEYVDGVSKGFVSVLKDTEEASNDIQVHFDRMGNIVAITSKTMEDDLSYSIAAIGTMFGNDAWTVQPMSANMKDLINVVDTSSGTFKNSFWGLMNEATYILGDPSGMMQRALFSSLDMPVTEIVGIGAEIGIAIADGILDSTPEVSSAAHHMAGEIAKEWNIFGSEADEFFKAIFENGMSAMNLVGGQTVSTTFNPKKIRIRGYASGGFPKSADFFYANENGVPEYVGSMGGKTAVANNAEITKGVSDGVYKAIKDTGLINDVKRIAGKEGKIVFAPSEEAGKVMSQSVNMYNGVGGRY